MHNIKMLWSLFTMKYFINDLFFMSQKFFLKYFCSIVLSERGAGIIIISNNSTVFYLKSANLIGSPTVFYLLIENSQARVTL